MQPDASSDATVLPSPCLVILVGPVASGKTSWATQWFPASSVVSSDALRALVGESEHDMAASTDAFAVVDDVIARRMRRGLTTVVDSLGLDAGQRERWRAHAGAAGIATAVVVFDTDAAECRRRNAARELPVRADVVANQLRRWPAERDAVLAEPWAHVLRPEPVATVPARLTAGSRRASRPTVPAAAGPHATRPVRFGLHLSDFEWPGGRERFTEHLRGIVEGAEQNGVEQVWLMDHLRQIPQVAPAWHDLPDPVATLSWIASMTTRIRLGTLVSPAFLRHPALLAKSLATLDVLSGGRAICGLGVGWFRKEYEAAGIAFPSTAERYEHLEDVLEVLPLFWGKGAPAFAGRRIRVAEAFSYPRPLQERIPIWVGGSGPRRTLRLVARYADACNLFGEPDDVARAIAALHAHCRDVDRDPAEIEVSHLSTVLVGRDRAEVAELVDRLRPRRVAADRYAAHVNAGTVDDHAHRIERLADVGVTTFIVRLADVAEAGASERLGALVGRCAASKSSSTAT